MRYLPNRANIFTMWRPTSNDAISKMMLGLAVGKGLESVRHPHKLSGYVPFLQIGVEGEYSSKKATITYLVEVVPRKEAKLCAKTESRLIGKGTDQDRCQGPKRHTQALGIVQYYCSMVLTVLAYCGLVRWLPVMLFFSKLRTSYYLRLGSLLEGTVHANRTCNA